MFEQHDANQISAFVNLFVVAVAVAAAAAVVAAVVVVMKTIYLDSMVVDKERNGYGVDELQSLHYDDENCFQSTYSS